MKPFLQNIYNRTLRVAKSIESSVRRVPFLHAFRIGSAAAGLATAVVFASGYQIIFAGEDSSATTVSTQTVSAERRDIVNSIKALGKVTLANEQQMRFNVLGEVTKVYVKAGDPVKKGDLIAELDKKDPMTDVRTAQLSYNDALLSLKNLESNKDQQILSASNTVRETERQLRESYADLPIQEQEVQNAIEQAKKTVQEKEAAYLKSKQDLYNGVRDGLVDAEDLLNEIYGEITGDLVVRGSTRTRVFAIDYLYNDQNLKNETEWAYYEANNRFGEAQTAVEAITDPSDIKQLSKALKVILTSVDAIRAFADKTYQFSVSTVPSSKYDDSDINAFKTAANGYRSTAISLENTMNALLATLTNVNTNTAKIALDDARQSLDILEKQFENGTSTADSAQRSIEGLEDQLRQKQMQYDQTTTSLDIQISQQKNSVSQRAVAIQKAQAKLEDYELRAPFDGVVRTIDFQVGDNLLADANDAKYVVLENPEHLIITVQLDQVDVVHVKIGQPAKITLNALPDDTFDGTVESIDTTPIEQSGVVSYEVKIGMAKTDKTILSGMTATIEIETERKDGVIAVPNLALQKAGNRTSVQMADGTIRMIGTGLSDGRYTEVVSGLSEGEQIKSINVSLGAGSSATGTNGGGNGQDAMRNIMRATGGGGGFRPRN